MITEPAILRISPDTNARFEVAFASVEPLLADAEGRGWHRLVASVDRTDHYLLEVEWRDLAAHTEFFAGGMVPFPGQMPAVFAGPSLPSWRASIRLGRAICQDLHCTEACFARPFAGNCL